MHPIRFQARIIAILFQEYIIYTRYISSFHFFLLNFKIVDKLEKSYIENLKLKRENDSSYFCVAD